MTMQDSQLTALDWAYTPTCDDKGCDEPATVWGTMSCCGASRFACMYHHTAAMVGFQVARNARVFYHPECGTTVNADVHLTWVEVSR